jgi:hypothetical protein
MAALSCACDFTPGIFHCLRDWVHIATGRSLFLKV